MTSDITQIKDLDYPEEKMEKLKQRKSELVAETWLSPREAEIYILFKEEDLYELQQVAEELDVTRNTVYKNWRSIKDKFLKSKETNKLEVF